MTKPTLYNSKLIRPLTPTMTLEAIRNLEYWNKEIKEIEFEKKSNFHTDAITSDLWQQFLSETLVFAKKRYNYYLKQIKRAKFYDC